MARALIRFDTAAKHRPFGPRDPADLVQIGGDAWVLFHIIGHYLFGQRIDLGGLLKPGQEVEAAWPPDATLVFPR